MISFFKWHFLFFVKKIIKKMRAYNACEIINFCFVKNSDAFWINLIIICRGANVNFFVENEFETNVNFFNFFRADFFREEKKEIFSSKNWINFDRFVSLIVIQKKFRVSSNNKNDNLFFFQFIKQKKKNRSWIEFYKFVVFQ